MCTACAWEASGAVSGKFREISAPAAPLANFSLNFAKLWDTPKSRALVAATTARLPIDTLVVAGPEPPDHRLHDTVPVSRAPLWLARARLSEIFPKVAAREHCVRRPDFSLEKNGFTRVNLCGPKRRECTRSPSLSRRQHEHPSPCHHLSGHSS